MTAIMRFLERLDRVRQIGADKWIAACPAHQDGSPSLSIRETESGVVLLHCFALCKTEDILAAVGLGFTDLYPQRLPGIGHGPTHSRIPARDLLQIVSEEVTVIATIAADILAKKNISEPDWKRLTTAASRINRAKDYCHG